MSIQYAILGLLSWQPYSGYDLKKVFAESSAFYWSGNNNQIYKTLVQLHEDDLVTQSVHYQESLPARKIYTITEKGRAALKQWLLSTPELPELRNTFLIRLACADMLTNTELEGLLERYEEEVRVHLLMQQEQARRDGSMPSRNPREAYLWEMVGRNIVSTYENELNWVRDVRGGLGQLSTHKKEEQA